MKSSNMKTALFSTLCLVAFAGLSEGLMCASGVDSAELVCTGPNIICSTVRVIDEGVIFTLYQCLDKNENPHWQDSCNGGDDSDISVRQCCACNRCNAELKPRLPSEEPVTTEIASPSPCNSTATTESPVPDHLIECHLSFGNEDLPEGHPGFCRGTTCFAERERAPDGSIHTRHGCLTEGDEVNITVFCMDPPNEWDSAECCTTDYCNRYLEPTLPSERQTPSSDLTDSSTTLPTGNQTITTDSDGVSSETGQRVDIFEIVAIVIGVIGFLAVLISILVTLVVLWHCRRKGQPKAPYNTPRKRELSSTTSTESNISSEPDSGAQLA